MDKVTLELIKLWVEIIEPIAKMIAILIGAIWAYNKYIIRREREPATEIDMDLRFIGIQEEKWIIEVAAILENKSQVRHKYEDFELTVRYITAEDQIVDGGPGINYQLVFNRTIDQDRLPEGMKRVFHNADFINPNLQFRHRYISYLPIEATFVWIQGKFFFSINGKRVKTNSQRIFRVPRSEAEILPQKPAKAS